MSGKSKAFEAPQPGLCSVTSSNQDAAESRVGSMTEGHSFTARRNSSPSRLTLGGGRGPAISLL